MTGVLIPGSFCETDIALETREGKPIPNSQSHEFSPAEIAQYAILERAWAQVEFRTPPNPIYNCHGLTFASKRTGIWETAALHTILNDDGYTEVDGSEVLPGDIILYYTETGDVEHSGIVVTTPNDQLGIPKVVSKWGRYREAVHWAHMCPYEFSNMRYYRVTEWD